MRLNTTLDGQRRAPSFRSWAMLCGFAALIAVISAPGCAHYPVNKQLSRYDPRGGYRAHNFKQRDNDDRLLLLLTFSGGGTRAAAFSYGVLETLRDTEVTIDGRRRRLLDEVDSIIGVSGGSFTAAYYGLFGDRIFKDFETRFLKKDIQGKLAQEVFFKPFNWGKLFSAYYDRSDLAAEYYDRHVFDRGTFADIMARGGPMIVINATDMVQGTRFSFIQGTFDAICADLLSFPVARACAASSAVPVALSPITLRNRAGECGYSPPRYSDKPANSPGESYRRIDLANDLKALLDSENKPYIHLVDGGVADNLGLRSIIEHTTLVGDPWTSLKRSGSERVNKIVFVVVNAETAVDDKWDRCEAIPPFAATLSSYATTAIARYNVETIALLTDSIDRWAEEIRRNRCGEGRISTEPGSCGDVKFYLAQVKFDALQQEAERKILNLLPTSFVLKPEEVDMLRDAARSILTNSEEFRRLVSDLR